MYDVVRKQLEKTYEGSCTVTESRKIKNKETKLTDHQEDIVLTDQPCKLSYEKITITNQTDFAAKTGQVTKLFISPDVVIKPGSKITVTQSGTTTDYTYSGVPAVYSTHQEIILELFERWA